jgi:hypothetical protein
MFARNLIERAEPNKAKFVDAGLKENFLDSLRADVTKFQKVLEEKDLSFQVATGALGLAPPASESLQPVVTALRAAAERVARRLGSQRGVAADAA